MNENLVKQLEIAINRVEKPYNKIIFFCIGTDRSTGDSFGPIVGHMLKQKLKNPNIEVLGTLHNPVHAMNLKEKLASIDTKNNLIIAIDAAAGKSTNIGKINIENDSIHPGKAMGKSLPSVGDICIQGITTDSLDRCISISNVRLSLVYDLASTTVNAIVNLFQQEILKEVACI